MTLVGSTSAGILDDSRPIADGPSVVKVVPIPPTAGTDQPGTYSTVRVARRARPPPNKQRGIKAALLITSLITEFDLVLDHV